MQLTLKQARRVEREIGKELEKETSHGAHRANTVSIYVDLRSKVAEAQEAMLSDLSKVKELVRIRFAIRKDIESQNEISGLNTLMNREAELKYMLQVLTNLMGGELTDSELEIAVQRHAAAKAAADNGTPLQNRFGQPSDEVSLDSIIRTESMETLRTYAKSIQREVVKLVESQAALNVNAKVVVNDADAKLLEQAGIVL